MKTWRGILRRGMMGPGFWKLEADDGRSYQLVGTIPSGLEGQRVKVKGNTEGLMGMAALAGVIEVVEIGRIRGTLGEP